jgi:protein SCO1/2
VRADDRLAVIRQAPDFKLTDQDGRPFRLADLRGRVVLVGFVFTTCNGTCPATTHRMSQIAEKLAAERRLTDGVRLVSITLDPERDRPEVLRRYMKLFDVDPARWSFLTGSVEQVNRVLTAWGMWARPTARGQLDHPSRVYLLDTRGRVREIYSLEFLQPDWVIEDVRLLLKEADQDGRKK